MLISISCVTWGKNQWTSVYSLVILYYLMFYAESPKLCLQRKLDKRPNRVADESGHEFYANSQVWILHYFRWTSVLLSYLNDYRVQDYYYYFFFFFCLFDILINSQADIKTHETRCLWKDRRKNDHTDGDCNYTAGFCFVGQKMLIWDSP